MMYHQLLATMASSISTGREKVRLIDAILLLLGSQYEDFCKEEEVHLRVVRGKGMGMRHSSAVNDAYFLAVVELGLCTQLHSLGVEVYARFKDDILAVVQQPSCCRGLTEALTKGASSLYVVELESFSLVWCPMLDLFALKYTAV